MFSKQAVKINGARPHLLAREQGVNKKKELDDIAVETLRRVIDSVDNTIDLEKLDAFQKRQFTEQIYDTLLALLEESNRHLSQGDKQKVIQYVLDEIFGYGPINSLLNDPSVTEIMVNGCDNVFVERDGKITKTDITFRDNDHVLHAINRIITPLGRRIDESSPTVDARLPDGSRVNAIIPPLALKGPSITIRKFSKDPFTVEELIKLGTMTREMAMFLKSCVRSRINIIVSGGTGSGKTTTLNVLSSFIPDKERIVTIEDTAELQLCQNHVVTLESRPANIEGRGQFTIRELVINSLRMRPDRIVVGEVRGGEALDMLQAMNTGHDGSISTLHANNPRDALARLETMVLMAGMELPLRAIREQISSAIELIIQQSRFSDGSRRITRISEVVGMEGDNITLQDIFVFEHSEVDGNGNVIGKHVATGIIPGCLDKLKAHGEAIVAAEFMEWIRNSETSPDQLQTLIDTDTHTNEDKENSMEPEPTASNYMQDENEFTENEYDNDYQNLEDSVNTKNTNHTEKVIVENNSSHVVEQGLPVTLRSEQVEEGITEEIGVLTEEIKVAHAFSSEAKGKNRQGLSSRIPENMRGISIPVNKVTGLCGLINPGDRVDVLITYEEKSLNRVPAASTTVQNALILAIKDGSGKKENEEKNPRDMVILAVTPQQAEILAYAYLKGSFHLTLCPNSHTTKVVYKN